MKGKKENFLSNIIQEGYSEEDVDCEFCLFKGRKRDGIIVCKLGRKCDYKSLANKKGENKC